MLKKIFKIVALVILSLGIALLILLFLLGRGYFEEVAKEYQFINNIQKTLNKDVVFSISEKGEISDDQKNTHFEVKIKTDRIYRSCGFKIQTNTTFTDDKTTISLKEVEPPKGGACMAASPAQTTISLQMSEGIDHYLVLKSGFQTDKYVLSLNRGFINVDIKQNSFSEPEKIQFPRYSEYKIIQPEKEIFDTSGLTSINENYTTDGEHVYFKGELVESADATSFVAPNFEKGFAFHAKDKNNAYYFGRLIPNTDISSYEFLDDQYAKDKNNAYFREFKIEGVDIDSFVILGNNYAKDNNQVYYREKPLPTADVQSFGFNQNSGIRTQDDYFVFKMGIRVSGSKDDFTVLKEGYAKDNKTAYLYDKPIIGSNPETFEYFDGAKSDYSHDKNHAYYKGELIEGSDGKTFEPLNRYYSKDGQNVYLNGIQISNADPMTFEILDGDFTKDENHAYYKDSIIEGSDGETFELITKYYAKDKNRDYTYDEILELSGAELD